MAVDTEKQVIEVDSELTVRQLADRLGVSPINVIKELMNNGIMASINQTLDFDTAAIVGGEMGFEIVLYQEEVEVAEVEDQVPTLRQTRLSEEDAKNLALRPPVVTVLGHVDHGKTTLLDAIRKANVVGGEAGGITQHIGAYQVQYGNHKITFLDTPGHQAFTAMRARGAMVTDLVILVVAADDGVMPQTKEAIGHARAAGVPIIVAINKVDRPEANLDKVKQDLANENLIVEDWGGDVIAVPVSALNQEGIDDLLENVLLTAELAELKANPDRLAQGTVVEARLDIKRGVTVTLLVQNGSLKTGDTVVIGTNYGRVKAMFDDQGREIKKAGPSTPISFLGLSEVPDAGDFFEAVENKKAAEALVANREVASRTRNSQRSRPVTLEDFLSRLQGEEVKELNLIVKADVQGSLEPIVNSLEQLGDNEHKVRVLLQGTGNVSESDVNLAVASDAIVVGFHVDIDGATRRFAEGEGVEVKRYQIIYKLIEDIELALKGLYEPVFEDRVMGHAEVRAVFTVSNHGVIAGCYVVDGKISRGSLIRVVRERRLLYDGKVSSLRRFTDDVNEVSMGFECGIGVTNFKDFKLGDILEAYVREQVN
jgi:translation initiation factor IF-2